MVTPGRTSAATMSSTSRDSLQTLRIASWPFSSRVSILALFRRLSLVGTPVTE